MKVWAVAMCVIKLEVGEINIKVSPGVVHGDTREDATKLAHELLALEYPPEDGWTGHTIEVLDVL